MTDYLTAGKQSQYSFEISHSKFICTLTPISSYDEGLTVVAATKKKYSDATHNCYAIVATPQENQSKFSDDGEPGGTAGQPILAVLTKNALFGVVAVVTRYFGGIKLGAGGLVSAYTKAVAECIKQSEVVQKVWSAIIVAKLTYACYKLYNSVLKLPKAKVLDTQYEQEVTLTLAVPAADEDKTLAAFKELTLGDKRTETIKYEYIIY